MRLELTPRAREDLARIFDFNQARSLQWAEKVDGRLVERTRALAAMPNLGRPIGKPGLFRLSVTDIQYVIDYRVGADFVRILRIQHTREIR